MSGEIYELIIIFGVIIGVSCFLAGVGGLLNNLKIYSILFMAVGLLFFSIFTYKIRDINKITSTKLNKHKIYRDAIIDGVLICDYNDLTYKTSVHSDILLYKSNPSNTCVLVTDSLNKFDVIKRQSKTLTTCN